MPKGAIVRERLYTLLEGEHSKASIMYGRVMTVLIIASLLPLCFKESILALNILESLCVAVFVVDYIARWATADLKLKKGSLSFLLYPFTPMAIVDLVSILPSFIMLNEAFRTLRVLRLFKALRAFKLIRYSRGATAISRVFIKQKKSLLAVLSLALGYIFISAIVVFNVEPETFDTFFEAVYWAVVSLTTVGYGDLYPATRVGREIAMVSSLMGIAIVALPSGIITAGLLDELRNQGDRDSEDDSDDGSED